MKNKDYWMKRALLREEESAERTAKILERMYRLYQKAAKQISKDVNSFILKYGSKHGLTYDQAAKKLNQREYREWKKTLCEYVEEIRKVTDPKERAKLVARLDALSANSSINRLDALMAEIEQNMDRLYLESSETLRASFGDTFAESYYKKVYDIQSRAGRINDFAHIDEKLLEDVLSYPWSGANFSDRLWKNKENLVFRLQESLTDSFIRGTSTAQLAKDLSDELGKGFTAAETLIRTECSWLHGEADRRAYTAAGVAQYEYMATLDSRTSKICADLDGKHFDLDKAQVGVNYPPMHPRCRSTTVEYDPEDELDWFNSGEKMPKNMTYEEWVDANEIVFSGTTADYAKTTVEFGNEEMQSYRPIRQSKEVYSENRGKTDLTMKKVENSSYAGDIYISESVILKQKQFHRIEVSLNKALDIVKQKGDYPKCVIISSQEMQTNALCSYNAAKNTLFINSSIADLDRLVELQQGMACPNNVLSTYVHEIIHWMDAVNYRKTADIKNQSDYLRELRKKHKKNVDNLIKDGYNISEISEYALNAYYGNQYDEVWTEYRVLQLLGRRE